MQNDLCYSTTFFGYDTGGMDFFEGIDILQQADVRIIEWSRKQKITEERINFLKQKSLRVWAVHGTLGSGAVSQDKHAFRQAIDNEIQRIQACKPFAPCPYVIHYLHRFHDPEYGKRFRTALELLLEANSEIGLILTLETVPHKPENERYPDSLEVASFVRSFQHENLQITIDINHSNLREDLQQVCENCKGLIANIHVSDNHGIREEHLIPGDGIIDLKTTMAALRKNGYQGPCNLELHLEQPISVDLIKKISNRVENILDGSSP